MSFPCSMAAAEAGGRPHERPVEEVLEDVWNGYISKETARKIYGVALNGWPPKVDEAETRRLRQ
jgi:N-methylhydantoinase B